MENNKFKIGSKVILNAKLSDKERECCVPLTKFVDSHNGTIVTIANFVNDYYFLEESPDIYCFTEDELLNVAHKRYKHLEGLYGKK